MGYRRPGRESESKGQGSLRGKWSRDVYRIFYWRGGNLATKILATFLLVIAPLKRHSIEQYRLGCKSPLYQCNIIKICSYSAIGGMPPTKCALEGEDK